MADPVTPLQVTRSLADKAFIPPEAQDGTLIIFGASGDLTARKLIPALYHLWDEGYLTDSAPIIGVARTPKTDAEFRQEMFEAVGPHAATGHVTDDKWRRFAERLYYHAMDITRTADYQGLQSRLESIEPAGRDRKRMVYLATAPSLFERSIRCLHEAGMIPPPNAPQKLRVVIEKPFGRDLESARELTRALSQLLDESQIFRIDHYLGKETVQNILLFRFGNSIFEPLLNRNHVDHVQITVAESQGMERGRGDYYDRSGALRDVLQNHLLQLVCLIGMEPPAFFQARDILDEKKKVLQALAPANRQHFDDWAIRGQYTAAEVNSEQVPGYREEENIPPDSNRDTFVAMQVFIDNWRWAGVPFYLRTGKRLPERVSEIAIQFKLPPLSLFTTVECEGDICDLVETRPNSLVFRIQPQEEISLTFSTKRPGMQYQIHPVEMDFVYQEEFKKRLPEAYERLLLDVMRGDSTLFTRSDELEAAWKIVTPVLNYWEKNDVVPQFYPAGTWGPQAAEDLIRRSGRSWREPNLEK